MRVSDDKTTTNDDRWQRVQELFHGALELEGDARRAFLAAECGDDPGLLRDVEELLTGHTQDASDLSRVVFAMADEALAESGNALIGRRVGAYELVRHLGVGGMGTVYLGERVDGHYRQQVAVKLINPAMLSERLLDRFLAERQILADLEHPNIARLLDGGSTADGFPYLVMEYVDGTPIDVYCRQQDVPTPRRLEMFRTVCDAVHYAHGRLIVHRDLKPGNILVTADGVPKLLDFGIAKLLDSGDDSPTISGNERPMTPQYASPEQVRGQAVTTATDVYALGVLLYKLLTDRVPFDPATSPGTSLEKLVCESEPKPPSLNVGPVDGDGARPQRLRTALSGDLDNIVLMALRKEPERRYSSAEQFAEDIRRHLARLPVIARPASVGYRVQRYVQRHWLGLAAAAMVVGVITALVSFYTLRLGDERDLAERNAERAQQVTTLLTDVFQLGNPSESRGREITAREILDAGAERVQRELAGDPPMLARMLNTIGHVYQGLAQYEKAADLHRQALDVVRATRPLDEEELVESLTGLGQVYFELARYEDAVALQEEAKAVQQRRLTPDDPRLASAINQLGFHVFHAGDVDRAEALFQQAFDIFERAGVDDTYGYVVTLMNYAQSREYQGDFETSVSVLSRALDLLQEIEGEDHPEVATGFHNLGVALHQLRRFDDAEAAYRRALVVSRQLFDEDHPDIAATTGAMGRMLHEQGKLADAEPYYREALAHSRRVLGNDHTYTGYDLANLGSLLLDMGQFDAAESAYSEALAVYDRSLPADHPYIASALTAYSRLLNATERADEALQTIERALAICRSALADDHWLLATGQSVKGRSLALNGNLDGAEALLPDALARLVEARGADDPRSRRARDWTVALFSAMGQPERAAAVAAGSETP